MTAVASPPSFPQISRPAWGSVNGNNSMDPDEVREMFAPRKQLSRTLSSSSDSSTSSVATSGTRSNGTTLTGVSDLSQWSASTGSRKRSQPKGPWPSGKQELQPDGSRLPHTRQNGMLPPQNGIQPIAVQNHVMQQQPPQPPQPQHAMRGSMSGEQPPAAQPVLYLLSLNGTFERKTIVVPFAPDCLRIGRQTNQKTVPTPTNGYFDSKVLSRQHAEIYAERNGKIYIRDVKSSNGTFVNGSRLSLENRESDPHELQTADHLELGIDIVSEDQKTVVHHKVAAKVEHAGFPSNTNNVLDMSFGDLDPASGTMMIPNGPLQMRGRLGGNPAAGNYGNRMMAGNNGPVNGQANGVPPQRSFFLAPIATDLILKRLSTEMRNARLQAQDLGRTNQFIHALLTKADVKDLEKSEMPEPGKIQQPQPSTSGRLPFRSDTKPRFSEPPAPPPQQPLPEKPDAPSLKRGATDRSKSGPPNTASPVRQENLNQIIQLTEALKNAKRDIESQTARMRELEEMLKKEREARELAEDLAKRLEATAHEQVNGPVALTSNDYHPIIEANSEPEDDADGGDVEPLQLVPEPQGTHRAGSVHDVEASLQTRIDIMDEQMKDLRDQLEQLKHRCESAESERDESRKSLGEMVVQLRAEEAKRIAAEEWRRVQSRTRSRTWSRSRSRCSELTLIGRSGDEAAPVAAAERLSSEMMPDKSAVVAKNESDDGMTLSRTNTITPLSSQRGLSSRYELFQDVLPYASMIGVVLIGMGVMAYINGWQPTPPPSRIER
ncbi:hypothetical protein E4U43_008277 [Claviceps pusilla]|uniref:FHA domain-containing protein n=1 Tax=Claviceps pusilla TaxID=123648 RepID=A0A9P7SXE6_9HYPO|nr:hypothetical protein E4U43_008277 [Claviceps pusilla]